MLVMLLLSVYRHGASLKIMLDHGGNRTYDLWNDRVAQSEEHWASIPKVVGSIPTMVRHNFQACPVWIYIQSNITNIRFTHTNTQKKQQKNPNNLLK